MKSKIVLSFLLPLFLIGQAKGQQDSVKARSGFFALTADDITKDQRLVESLLNRKTTIAAQTEQFASEAPATVYVISKEQIQNRGYESLLDVLDDIPEVEIQRYGSPEFNQHISFRGVAGNEKFLILQDGVRISAPTGDTHSIGYNFSVEHAEQVEVIIGPASALYGADAFSGIIQIITQKNQSTPLQLKSSYGNYNTTHNALHYSRKIGAAAIAFSGAFYHSDEPDFTQIYPEDFAWYRNNYLNNGELLISPFFQQPVEVTLEGNDRQFEMPTNSYYANLNISLKNFELGYNRHYDAYTTCGSTQSEYCLYSKESQFAYFIETIFGRHQFRSPNLKWLFQTTISLHTYQLDNETAFVNTYTGYDRGYKMEFGKSKKIEERIFFNANPNLSFIGGFSYEILDDLPLTGDLPKPFNFDQPADLQNQYYLGSNFIDQNGNDLSIQQDFFYLHYLNYGTYLQMQANLNSSLNLTAGIRYDINTRYGESVNPRLGLVWTPTEELTVKMLYGESLLSPSPRKSNSHFGAFFPVTDSLGNITGLGSNFFHLSNPDLQPEKLRSVEGSLRYVLSNNLIFTLNAYYTNIDNLINKFVQNTEVASFKGVEIGFIENSANEGTADIYGGTARLDAVYNLQNGLGLNFYAGYSFSDGKTDDGPLLFNARHHIKAGVELTHPRFVISPRMIYRSTSLGSILDDSGQPIGSDPFTIFNIFAKVNIFQKQNTSLSVFTKINNLFDTRYYNVFIGGAEGFPRVPQRPRVWTIGAKLNY
jgi:iron complex outermembrane receptor protein